MFGRRLSGLTSRRAKYGHACRRCGHRQAGFNDRCSFILMTRPAMRSSRRTLSFLTKLAPLARRSQILPAGSGANRASQLSMRSTTERAEGAPPRVPRDISSGKPMRSTYNGPVRAAGLADRRCVREKNIHLPYARRQTASVSAEIPPAAGRNGGPLAFWRAMRSVRPTAKALLPLNRQLQ